jgi:hypothetical protein
MNAADVLRNEQTSSRIMPVTWLLMLPMFDICPAVFGARGESHNLACYLKVHIIQFARLNKHHIKEEAQTSGLYKKEQSEIWPCGLCLGGAETNRTKRIICCTLPTTLQTTDLRQANCPAWILTEEVPSSMLAKHGRKTGDA